ncbi:ribonuclease H-like domain-containing protein [Leucosporidium creatinivorum]|uniref:Ribonuclease H-like domain-containing protein n=1 Tax=Leucosporidium creatinivorum TaxID=106004 RepID=A0A1Y2D0C4_9BASI|nr:ribonuclease H-like domain-containing protein [Leucosporidium creatinivorum]
MSHNPSGYPTGPPPPPPPPPPPAAPAQQQQQLPGAVLEPIARPRRQLYNSNTGQPMVDANGAPVMELAKGRIGRPILVQANVFYIRLNAPEQTVWYKYQVTILPVRQSTAANLPPPLPPKTLLRKIWQALEMRETDPSTSTGFFNGQTPVYDGRNACFSAGQLPGIMSTTIILPGQGARGFSVDITNPIAISLDELRSWYTGSQRTAQADANDALSALNTLFHHGLALLYPANSKTIFVNDPGKHCIAATATRDTPGHQPHSLEKGIELWRGFFESVRTCERGLLLNLDTTTGAFVKPGNAVRVVMDFIPTRRHQDVYANALRSTDRISVNRLLKGATVKVHLGHGQPKLMKIRLGLTRGSASQTTFELRDVQDGSTRTVTVEDYFRIQYGVALQDPDFPCMEVKPGVMYPLELCEIQPGTKSNRRLTAAQQVAATAFQTLKPSERFSTVSVVRANTLLAHTEPRLVPFQVELAPRTPKNIRARVLEPPSIAYSQGRRSEPSFGAWKMARNQDRFVAGAACRSVAVILCSDRYANSTAQFLQAFWSGARGLGMDVPQRPIGPQHFHVWDGRVAPGHSPTDEAQRQIRLALDLGGRFYNSKPDLVFYVTDKQNDPMYNSWKAAGAAEGVATQTLRTKGLQKATDFQFVINVAMKINGKLGGLNFSFVPDTAGGDRRKGWLDANAPLVLAADLTHIDEKPSIATVIASMDSRSLPLLYQAAISVQRLLEPLQNSPSKRGKKQEIIEGMEDMVLELLKAYFRLNRRAPSNNVVMYRDGVSDSEWSAVLSIDPAAKRAFARFIKEVPEVEGWEPKLTYIVCVKRHHMRFFGSDPSAQEGRNQNIPAGTVIDDAVVDPRAFDWYGAAHTGILGTTRPTRYVVMDDEQTPRLTPDDVQSMTHALCHAYQRCTRAVSIPAPCYYADLVCQRVRAWMPMDLDDQRSSAETATSSEGDAASRREDLKFFTEALDHAKVGLAAFEASAGRPPIQWWL